jgi:hypothetical protein
LKKSLHQVEKYLLLKNKQRHCWKAKAANMLTSLKDGLVEC